MKAEDEFARHPGDPEITEELTTSYLSGRTNQELAAAGDIRVDHAARGKIAKARKRLLPDPGKVDGARKKLLPAFQEPSLASPCEKPPSGPKWIHEIKHNGYRLQARIDGASVRLLTRKGLDWTQRFSSLAAAREEDRSRVRAPGRGGGGRGCKRHHQLQQSAERPVGGPAGPLPLFRVRSPLLRRLRPHQGGADRSQEPAAADSRGPAGGLAGRGSASTWRWTGRPCWSIPAASGSKASSPSARTSPTAPAAASIGSSRSASTGRNSCCSATFPRARTAARSARWGSAIMRAARSPMRGGSGPAGPPLRPARCAMRSRRSSAKKPQLANQLPAGAEKGVRWVAPRLVGEIEFRGWTAGPAVAGGLVQGIARGQGGRGDRARERADSLQAAGRARARASPAHPSGAHSLAGAGHHQARARRVLRRDRRLDSAACDRPAAQPVALSLRHRRQMLLRQASLAGPGRQRRPRRRRREGADDGDRRPGRPPQHGAGRRGRDPSLGIARGEARSSPTG